jgi:hypothetical protein
MNLPTRLHRTPRISRMIRLAVLALSLIAVQTSEAQRDVLVVSSAFADPSLVAPVVRLEVDRGDGTSYAAGISGWTVDGEWTKRVWPGAALRFAADATPLNAHNSNLMYANRVRAEEDDYDNASYRARGGMRFKRGERHTLDLMAVALYEIVDGLSPGLEARWDSPYAGVDLSHTFSVMNAREPLIGAFDGIQITSRGEFFTGERNWSRISVVQQAGRNVGRFHLRQSLALLDGSALDVVNEYVVGGSWDALGGKAVYGLRYGQLRTDRAVILNGGADVRLVGTWRAGLRASYADTREGRTYGQAINASMTWKTVGLNFGVGFDEDSTSTVYGALIVPLYRGK